jgi:hypothetical protein
MLRYSIDLSTALHYTVANPVRWSGFGGRLWGVVGSGMVSMSPTSSGLSCDRSNLCHQLLTSVSKYADSEANLTREARKLPF